MRSQTCAPEMYFSSIRLASLATLTLLWCAFAFPSEAQATKRTSHKATASHTSPAKGAVKVKGSASRSPSEETRAERERRLYRECRGMHDAGACKGFTRGRR